MKLLNPSLSALSSQNLKQGHSSAWAGASEAILRPTMAVIKNLTCRLVMRIIRCQKSVWLCQVDRNTKYVP